MSTNRNIRIMSTLTGLTGIFIAVSFLNTSLAQEEVKKETKKVHKDVRCEEKNGEKVLTIIPDNNGKMTREEHTGNATGTKLKGMDVPKEAKVRKIIIDKKADGEKPDETHTEADAAKKMKKIEKKHSVTTEKKMMIKPATR